MVLEARRYNDDSNAEKNNRSRGNWNLGYIFTLVKFYLVQLFQSFK